MRLAVIGTGVIGETHINAILRANGLCVCGVLDPALHGAEMAQRLDCPLYPNLDALIADQPDGVIIATPNALHAPFGVEVLTAGIPVFIEKPIAENVGAAERLVQVSKQTGVPGLVGHHRRYNPIIQIFKGYITEGRFGDLVMGTIACSLFKPNDYFDIEWRKNQGEGGPLLINLIHEIDMLRYLFGEITSVSAVTSNAQRGFNVEDTAGVIFSFAQGGIVTATVSDAAVGPWAWDIAAGENPSRFPKHPVTSHMFSGSIAGVSLPDLATWQHNGPKDWTKQLTQSTLKATPENCYDAQLSHFIAVIKGQEEPMVSLADGLASLRIIECIHLSAEKMSAVSIDHDTLNVPPAYKNMEEHP